MVLSKLVLSCLGRMRQGLPGYYGPIIHHSRGSSSSYHLLSTTTTYCGVLCSIPPSTITTHHLTCIKYLPSVLHPENPSTKKKEKENKETVKLKFDVAARICLVSQVRFFSSWHTAPFASGTWDCGGRWLIAGLSIRRGD